MSPHQLLRASIFIHAIIFVSAKPTRNMDWETCLAKQLDCCQLRNGTVQDYSKAKYLCCGGELTQHRHDVHCCRKGDNSSVYNNLTQICCDGGYLHQRNGKDHCCGKDLLTPNQLCCRDENDMLNKEYAIENSKHPNNCLGLGFCEGTAYDKSNKICCDGKLQTAKPNHTCCGDELFYLPTEVCCHGRTHEKTKDGKCCGQNYMTKHQKCCNHEILKGNQECCGGKPYISARQLCTIDDKIEPIGTPLCYEKKYDPSRQVCCEYGPMEKRHPDDNTCCRPGGSYNSRTEKCEYGRIYSTITCLKEHSENEYSCCDGFAYKVPAQNTVCCRGRAENIERGSDAQNDCKRPSLHFCNNEWYDIDREECCNNTLIYRRHYRCIEKKAYRYKNRRDAKSTDLKICGEYLISNKYGCCAGLMPYRKNRHVCLLNEFGNEKPIKTPSYPFWDLIKCRSKNRKHGRIINVDHNKSQGKITLYLQTNGGKGKVFTIHVSDEQMELTKKGEGRRAVVFYENETIDNELKIGLYGGIAVGRWRRNQMLTRNDELCKKIDAHFQS